LPEHAIVIKARLFKRNIACLRQRYQLSHRIGEKKGCQDLATGMPCPPLDGTQGIARYLGVEVDDALAIAEQINV